MKVEVVMGVLSWMGDGLVGGRSGGLVAGW
jgi:hypothetical protein